VDKTLDPVGMSFFDQACFQNSLLLKDARSRAVSIAISMPRLHRGSVNYFVQIGAYDNQEENY